MQDYIIKELCDKFIGMHFKVSYYEIYGGKCLDLLNNREELRILEDRNQKI